MGLDEENLVVDSMGAPYVHTSPIEVGIVYPIMVTFTKVMMIL